MICVYEIITTLFTTYEKIYGPYNDRRSALEDAEKRINGNDGYYSIKNMCEHLGWKVTYKIVDITVMSEEEVYALT